ncbi:MAG: hypothetical protein IIY94_00050, partial [Oscillospiraceae bacterium]|nr:hypothetical protein [Oscillospiraceae bacterium]
EAEVQATLRRLYAEGIGAAMRNSAQTGAETKNAAPEGGEVQYSVRRTKDMTLKEQLRSYYKHDGSFKSSDAFYFGESSVILGKAGIRPGSLAMTIKDFQKSTDKKHNIPRRVLNNLYSNLQNPVFSFDANGEAGVLIDDIDGDGKPVLVAIHTNETMDREHINLITSIYGLEHPKEWLKNQIDAKKKLTVFDKEKSKRFFQSYGYEASEGNTIRPVEERIAQEAPSVKPSDEKLATRSTTDSTGRELSEGQQEYFKDSRARDINGNLLVLYHQTENDFTVFDPRHEGSGTRDQQTPFGIFLKSSDRDIGVKGKKQMALYANITKPLVALNRESLESKLRDLSPEYAKLSDQHKAIDREYKQKHEQSKQAFTDYLTTWREQHPNAGRSEIYQDADFDRLWNAEDEIIDEWEQKARELETETKEVLTNALEAAGYDGIFLGNDTGSWGRSTDAYIALHPEQVKNVDNLNPTENPDIRFSTRDYSDISDLDLLLNAAEEISEGGGEDYWASLLESNPGLASEAEEIKRLGKQLKKTEGELAEARRNLTLTDRKLKTRGISTLAATIMQDQKAGDINNKDVKNRIVAVLTEAYQKALDKLDAGGDFSDAWEIVYYEGAEKATDILMQDATHAEKIGYKWYTNTLGEFLGEGGRGYVAADICRQRPAKPSPSTVGTAIGRPVRPRRTIARKGDPSMFDLRKTNQTTHLGWICLWQMGTGGRILRFAQNDRRGNAFHGAHCAPLPGAVGADGRVPSLRVRAIRETGSFHFSYSTDTRRASRTPPPTGCGACCGRPMAAPTVPGD